MIGQTISHKPLSYNLLIEAGEECSYFNPSEVERLLEQGVKQKKSNNNLRKYK
jgi:hypothetical protein